MVISKEDALFKNQNPKPKVSVQLCWISLFSKFSQIKTTASALSDELGVNEIVKKKVNGNWDNINKNGHSTFHTAGEPGNLNSL